MSTETADVAKLNRTLCEMSNKDLKIMRINILVTRIALIIIPISYVISCYSMRFLGTEGALLAILFLSLIPFIIYGAWQKYHDSVEELRQYYQQLQNMNATYNNKGKLTSVDILGDSNEKQC